MSSEKAYSLTQTNIPTQISNSKGAHDRTNNQAEVSDQSPNPYHPNTVSRIEHVLDAANNNCARDGREESTKDSTKNDTLDSRYRGNDNARDAVCDRTDDVKAFSSETF